MFAYRVPGLVEVNEALQDLGRDAGQNVLWHFSCLKGHNVNFLVNAILHLELSFVDKCHEPVCLCLPAW